jgi:hypothetical protein
MEEATKAVRHNPYVDDYLYSTRELAYAAKRAKALRYVLADRERFFNLGTKFLMNTCTDCAS